MADEYAVIRIRELEAEVSQLQDLVNSMESDNQALREDYSKILEVAEAGVALESEINTRDAKSTYDKVAEELNIHPAYRDDVFKLAEFEADGAVDPAALKSHMTQFLKDRPHYCGGRPPGSRLPADAMAGTGSAGPQGERSRLQVSRADLANADWTMQHIEDLKSGNFDII